MIQDKHISVIMNLVKLIIECQKNTNYDLVKIQQLINNYRHWEELSVCDCGNYSPHVLNGCCRICWKYGRKSDKEVLKLVLQSIDN